MLLLNAYLRRKRFEAQLMAIEVAQILVSSLSGATPAPASASLHMAADAAAADKAPRRMGLRQFLRFMNVDIEDE